MEHMEILNKVIKEKIQQIKLVSETSNKVYKIELNTGETLCFMREIPFT